MQIFFKKKYNNGTQNSVYILAWVQLLYKSLILSYIFFMFSIALATCHA